MMAKQRMSNYKRDMLEMMGQGVLPAVPGRIAIMHIYHDDGCAIWKAGGLCDCKPDYRWELPTEQELPAKMQTLMNDNSKIGQEGK